MPLSPKHARAIETLDASEFHLLSRRISEAVGRKIPFRSRLQLIKLCEQPSVHIRDLQMPFVRETQPLGVAVLECLVGHKITVGRTVTPQKFRPIKIRRARRVRSGAEGTVSAARGDMIIRLLTDKNPKRPGGAAHDRFAKYRDKMTVSSAMERGVRASDLRYDQKHEFIRLEEK